MFSGGRVASVHFDRWFSDVKQARTSFNNHAADPKDGEFEFDARATARSARPTGVKTFGGTGRIVLLIASDAHAICARRACATPVANTKRHLWDSNPRGETPSA